MLKIRIFTDFEHESNVEKNLGTRCRQGTDFSLSEKFDFEHLRFRFGISFDFLPIDLIVLEIYMVQNN